MKFSHVPSMFVPSKSTVAGPQDSEVNDYRVVPDDRDRPQVKRVVGRRPQAVLRAPPLGGLEVGRDPASVPPLLGPPLRGPCQ